MSFMGNTGKTDIRDFSDVKSVIKRVITNSPGLLYCTQFVNELCLII